MAFNRKCLLVICVASMFKSAVGECTKTLRNAVLQEGDNHTLDAGDDRSCIWYVVPSDVVFNTLKNVSDGPGVVARNFTSTYTLEGSSLVMHMAETQPGLGPYATSGVYIAECPDNACTTAAKVVVIKSGPICSCAYDRDSHTASLNITILYGDTPKNDMYPVFNFTLDDEVKQSDSPLPVREDKFCFRATSQYRYTSQGNAFGIVKKFKGSVYFRPPSMWPIHGMNLEAPAYVAHCDFDQACS